MNPGHKHIQSKAALHMMQQWPVFMDGIDRIVGFWNDGNNHKLQGMEWLRNSLNKQNSYFEASTDLDYNLQSSRNASEGFQWLDATKLPFESSSEIRLGQLDLFSESKYLVLQVRIRPFESELCDLYYLFFRNDKSNFGISDSQHAFSTSEKTIIGRLAFQFASSTLNLFQQQQNTFFEFKKQTQLILQSNHEQKIDKIKELEQWKIDWIGQYLVELGQRNGFNYVIHKSCIDALLVHCKNTHDLKKSIEISFVYICELYSFSPGERVELELAFLQLWKSDDTKLNKIKEPKNRLDKTMHLLDRLEQSALNLVNNGQSLTSSLVGKNMDKAITAPAISDALKKNRSRILQLFKQYPERWNCIRHQFKPIMNLKEKNTNFLSATS